MKRTLLLLWGIRRSGNHVLHNWMLHQFPQPRHCSLNVRHNVVMKREAEGKQLLRDYNALLIGWESYPLQTIRDIEERNHLAASMGEYDAVKKVILLRDPWNLFASRIKHGLRRLRHPADYLWVEYAKAFIEQPYDALYVNYNNFITDERYRKLLCSSLGGEFDDSSIDEVPKYGDGSSFDGQSYDGRGRQMDVFGRWKEYWNDPEYRKLFTPEVEELAGKLFEGARPEEK